MYLIISLPFLIIKVTERLYSINMDWKGFPEGFFSLQENRYRFHAENIKKYVNLHNIRIGVYFAYYKR